jgi:hypothetical protein
LDQNYFPLEPWALVLSLLAVSLSNPSNGLALSLLAVSLSNPSNALTLSLLAVSLSNPSNGLTPACPPKPQPRQDRPRRGRLQMRRS